jgi:hypothetical protein
MKLLTFAFTKFALIMANLVKAAQRSLAALSTQEL